MFNESMFTEVGLGANEIYHKSRILFALLAIGCKYQVRVYGILAIGYGYGVWGASNLCHINILRVLVPGSTQYGRSHTHVYG